MKDLEFKTACEVCAKAFPVIAEQLRTELKNKVFLANSFDALKAQHEYLSYIENIINNTATENQ